MTIKRILLGMAVGVCYSFCFSMLFMVLRNFFPIIEVVSVQLFALAAFAFGFVSGIKNKKLLTLLDKN